MFTSQRRDLEKTLRTLRTTLKPDAALWVSAMEDVEGPNDITEDVIRDLALPLGFVDIKVCAVDETWSGLKLVVRRELRSKEQPRHHEGHEGRFRLFVIRPTSYRIAIGLPEIRLLPLVSTGRTAT